MNPLAILFAFDIATNIRKEFVNMKIRVIESNSPSILTTLYVTTHIIATYEEVSDKDYPKFEFDDFAYESRKVDVAKELTSWELEIGPTEEDSAIFQQAFVDDAYFEDEESGDTGVIEIYLEIKSPKPLSDKDLKYISECVSEYFIDDANVKVRGEWFGEEEYWDGYSYEPSYRDVSGELDESATVRLDKSVPITYEVN